MAISYSVGFDLNHDGDFIDSNEALDADVFAARWWLGMEAPFEKVPGLSGAEITLRNTGAYSPESSSIAYLPGCRVRIQSDDGTVRTHFTGIAAGIETDTDETGRNLAVLRCVGIERELMEHTGQIALQVAVTADAVIEALINAVVGRHAVQDDYIILDRGTIGQKLFGSPWSMSFETGKSTFAYVGDLWDEERNTWELISEVAASECGRFFVTRAGQFVFYNRHHTIEDFSNDATIANDMRKIEYSYGAEVVNKIGVRVVPREVGAANGVVWELETPQKVHWGEAGIRQIEAKFRGDNDQSIGAVKVYAPRAGVDYTATEDRAGLGADYSAYLTVVLVKNLGKSALLELRNGTFINHLFKRDLYLQSGAVLRGQALIPGDPVRVEYRDQSSVTDYGLRALEVEAALIDDTGHADQLARHMVGQQKTAVGVVRWLEVDTISHPTQALARTLFDQVTVTDTAKGHSALYSIVREEHEVTGQKHKVRWLLCPSDSGKFFVLDRHKLDGAQVLAY